MYCAVTKACETYQGFNKAGCGCPVVLGLSDRNGLCTHVRPERPEVKVDSKAMAGMASHRTAPISANVTDAYLITWMIFDPRRRKCEEV
jgi:hypothetical protein